MIDNNILTNDTPIFRYISLPQFLFLTQNKLLHLSQIAIWEDPNEGYGAKVTSNFLKEISEKVITNEQIKEEEKNFFKSFEMVSYYHDHCCYGTSWSKLEESDAMWRIYSRNENGIKIKSTFQKLKEINEFKTLLTEDNYKTGFPSKCDEVIYMNQDKEKLDKTYPNIESYFFKKPEFKHEEEFRKIIFRYDLMHIKNEDIKNIVLTLLKVIYAKINLINFIDEIVVDPRATDWYLQSILKYCNSIPNLKNKFKGKSKLYEPDY